MMQGCLLLFLFLLPAVREAMTRGRLLRRAGDGCGRVSFGMEPEAGRRSRVHAFGEFGREEIDKVMVQPKKKKDVLSTIQGIRHKHEVDVVHIKLSRIWTNRGQISFDRKLF